MSNGPDVRYPDRRVQDILTEIEKAELELVEGAEFVEQDVYLDGRRFLKCTFRHCRLFIKLGHFGAQDCNFGDSEFVFDHPADTTRAFLSLLGRTE